MFPPALQKVWEAIAQRALTALSPILPRRFSRYGVIPARLVSDAIVKLVERREPGRYVHENADLQRLSGHADEISPICCPLSQRFIRSGKRRLDPGPLRLLGTQKDSFEELEPV
ncbi:hypothetical protein [Neorhizobium tomejilense]|uniref:hypothetical protein n=1 Tax=Neorhizobium tomejilense TaxID=2093828 RepID=UPI003ECD6D2C